MTLRVLVIGLAALASFGQGRSSVVSDPAITCGQCEAWNAPQASFRVVGNTYYVGTAGLSAVLITSDKGLILLDGALPQSARLIDQNIRAMRGMSKKLALRAQQPESNPFIDANACRVYAATASKSLDRRIAEEH